MDGFQSHGIRELIEVQRRQKRTKRIRLSRRFRQRIFFRDNGHCVYCDKPVKFLEATMDHVTPLTHRGKSRDKTNIVLSCKLCNTLKGPLVMNDLGDISPEALWLKFEKVCESIRKRKGMYI